MSSPAHFPYPLHDFVDEVGRRLVQDGKGDIARLLSDAVPSVMVDEHVRSQNGGTIRTFITGFALCLRLEAVRYSMSDAVTINRAERDIFNAAKASFGELNGMSLETVIIDTPRGVEPKRTASHSDMVIERSKVDESDFEKPSVKPITSSPTFLTKVDAAARAQLLDFNEQLVKALDRRGYAPTARFVEKCRMEVDPDGTSRPSANGYRLLLIARMVIHMACNQDQRSGVGRQVLSAANECLRLLAPSGTAVISQVEFWIEEPAKRPGDEPTRKQIGAGTRAPNVPSEDNAISDLHGGVTWDATPVVPGDEPPTLTTSQIDRYEEKIGKLGRERLKEKDAMGNSKVAQHQNNQDLPLARAASNLVERWLSEPKTPPDPDAERRVAAATRTLKQPSQETARDHIARKNLRASDEPLIQPPPELNMHRRSGLVGQPEATGRAVTKPLKEHEASNAPNRDDGTEIKIFISHKEKDEHEERVASALIEFLSKCMSIPNNTKVIRCTSLANYAYEGGDAQDGLMAKEAIQSPVFIALISKRSVESVWAQFEWGARWGSGRQLTPIIHPHATASILPQPIDRKTAVSLKDVKRMLAIARNISEATGFPMATLEHVHDATEALKEFVNALGDEKVEEPKLEPEHVTNRKVGGAKPKRAKVKPSALGTAAPGVIEVEKPTNLRDEVNDILAHQVNNKGLHTVALANRLYELSDCDAVARLLLAEMIGQARSHVDNPVARVKPPERDQYFASLAEEFERLAPRSFSLAFAVSTEHFTKNIQNRKKTDDPKARSEFAVLDYVNNKVYGHPLPHLPIQAPPTPVPEFTSKSNDGFLRQLRDADLEILAGQYLNELSSLDSKALNRERLTTGEETRLAELGLLVNLLSAESDRRGLTTEDTE